MCRLLSDRWYFHELNHCDDLGRIPFWYAARAVQFGMMDMLAPDFDTQYVDVKDCNPNQHDCHGHSALAIAAHNGRADVLAYLLNLRLRRYHANPVGSMIHEESEHFLLAFAVKSNNKECIDLILQNRTWNYGTLVYKRARAYALESKDQQLQTRLLMIYKEDSNLPF